MLFIIDGMAVFVLDIIFKDGYEYTKADIILFDIIPDRLQQYCLFKTEKYDMAAPKLMKLLDRINVKFGRQTLRLASENIERWNMNRNHLSDRYTTCWDGLLVVK